MFFPSDFVISQEIKDGVPTKLVNAADGIPNGWYGIDVGDKSRKSFEDVILGSKTIFLNGASGIFELGIAKAGSVSLVNVSNDMLRRYYRLLFKHVKKMQLLFVEEEIQSH